MSTSTGARPGLFVSITVRTAPDSTFTCAALPGHGFLAIEADRNKYAPARVDPKGFDENASMPHDTDRLWISIGGAHYSLMVAAKGLKPQGMSLRADWKAGEMKDWGDWKPAP